jgi:hypothetical protein
MRVGQMIQIIFATATLLFEVLAVYWCVKQIVSADRTTANIFLVPAFLFGLGIPSSIQIIWHLVKPSSKVLLTNPSSTLQIKESRLSRLPSRLFAFATIIFAVFIIQRSEEIDIPAIFLIGLGVLILANSFLTPRAELKLSPDGLYCSTLKVGTIAWDDIQSATIRKAMRQERIVLKLKDIEKDEVKSPKLQKRKELGFQAQNLGARASDIVEAIEIRRSVFSF